MRRRSVFLAVALLVLVAATACGDDDPDATPARDGEGAAPSPTGTWELLAFTEGGVAIPVAGVTGTAATMALGADGTVTGSTGCNSFRGRAEVAGPEIRIELGPTTLRACEAEGAQRQETALLSGLEAARRWRVEGDRLHLDAEGGGALLTFVGRSAPAGPEGRWAVTAVNTGEAIESSALIQGLAVEIADGRISGRAGCNSFTGSVTVDGEQLTVDADVARTLMACEDEAMALEERFLDNLTRVASYQVEGANLTLFAEDGTILFTLTAEG